eukprot:TRINITY_DN3702_c0_g1_i1.p1 TRINITY_DN3702_c0_g1~~TRINITY_DN3702_c0_g1_i1.p1  ORF type:complete len:206 (+),score=33.26 TRINITY_DN3702_c0_g1_i1:204-821(+)
MCREFPEISQIEPLTILEVGCGVGNTTYPLIEDLGRNDLHFYSFDFSPCAVKLLQQHEKFCDAVTPFVCDIVKDDLPDFVPVGKITCAMMIFVLSAISPESFALVEKKIYDVLAPGGWIFFRDYALGDLAAERFEEKGGRKISDNFFVRKDGTRAYYFSKEKMQEIFPADRYEIVQNHYVAKQVENKKDQIKMNRIWIQTKVIKK